MVSETPQATRRPQRIGCASAIRDQYRRGRAARTIVARTCCGHRHGGRSASMHHGGSRYDGVSAKKQGFTAADRGAFKTPTLRGVALTAPYMHDGSLKTLREVVEHYNNGGVTNEGDPVNDFLSGGIRPLNLTEKQIDDLVAFMEALTSPEFADLAKPAGDE